MVEREGEEAVTMETTILVGDCLKKLKELPDESVHCVITSPPYWGLRAYKGDPGMIGLEETFEQHLENLVEVFREVWRVLRKDGTCWLNYGDAYADGRTGLRAKEPAGPKQRTSAGTMDISHPPVPPGLKPKDLMMMPARVAMALQADGWWLRSEIIWHKPNGMPESVTDRPTSSHEKLFLLSKSAKYFYDAEAVRVAQSPVSVARLDRARYGHVETPPGQGDHTGIVGYRENIKDRTPKDLEGRGSRLGRAPGWRKSTEQPSGANLRNVWKIATSPYKEAHFATFPPKLVEPCIKAGTSEKGCCSECGAPWVREVERTAMEIRRSKRTHDLGRTRSSGTMTKPPTCETTGWYPTCDHDAEPVPAVCLDPFSGAGTVGLVAQGMGRDSILIEISQEYAEMSRKRIAQDMPLFSQVKMEDA